MLSFTVRYSYVVLAIRSVEDEIAYLMWLSMVGSPNRPPKLDFEHQDVYKFMKEHRANRDG